MQNIDIVENNIVVNVIWAVRKRLRDAVVIVG